MIGLRGALHGLAILAVAGCYAPPAAIDCGVSCGTGGACPNGYDCREGWCRAPGATGACGGADATAAGDASRPVDATAVADVNFMDVALEVCTGFTDGSPCPNGLCHGGLCDQASCWVGGTWIVHGARDVANGCAYCDVTADRLAWSLEPVGIACSIAGANGTCRGGGTAVACCTGCWDGLACAAGTSEGACGAGGAMCTGCGANFCRPCDGNCDRIYGYACSGGACVERDLGCCEFCNSCLCFAG
jgi:hypothetical protein